MFKHCFLTPWRRKFALYRVKRSFLRGMIMLSLLYGQPVGAAPEDIMLSKEAKQYWQERVSPEQTALFQFVGGPLGLGYFSQGEAQWGAAYTGIQLSLIFFGTMLQPEMNGSSPTQLFAPLAVGLWLTSVAHSSQMANQKNRTQASQLGLLPETIHQLEHNPSFLTEWRDASQGRGLQWQLKAQTPLWLTREAAPLLFGNPSMALQIESQIGNWLATFAGDWAADITLQMGIQGGLSLNGGKIATQPEEWLPMTHSLGVDLALVRHQSINAWDFYYGLYTATQFRMAGYTMGEQGRQNEFATYQGWGVTSGVGYWFTPQWAIQCDLRIAHYNVVGKSIMADIPALFGIIPSVGVQHRF